MDVLLLNMFLLFGMVYTVAPQTNVEVGGANIYVAKPIAKKLTKAELADLSKGIHTIVNKKYYVKQSYRPGVNKTADKQVKKMIKDMQSMGFEVWSTYTGYRSYEFQNLLYTNYVKERGQEASDRFSARPGHSEHQLGLAFDIKSTSKKMLGKQESDSLAVKWMHSNCHKYGFVLRYMQGKEHITGYMYEPWHIRYVGDEAEKIYKSGLTLEEYFGVEGGDYID